MQQKRMTNLQEFVFRKVFDNDPLTLSEDGNIVTVHPHTLHLLPWEGWDNVNRILVSFWGEILHPMRYAGHSSEHLLEIVEKVDGTRVDVNQTLQDEESYERLRAFIDDKFLTAPVRETGVSLKHEKKPPSETPWYASGSHRLTRTMVGMRKFRW